MEVQHIGPADALWNGGIVRNAKHRDSPNVSGFASHAFHTEIHGCDGAGIGRWTVLIESAQKTARVHLLVGRNWVLLYQSIFVRPPHVPP